MFNCYSYESVDIEAAYREHEYRREAEEYRYLHNISRTNQGIRNKVKRHNLFIHQIYSNIRYLWLRHVNVFSRMEEDDSLHYYPESRRMQ